MSKQLGDAQQLQQLKLTAQSAITEVGKQAELQRDLKRNLIRAKADLDVLLLDDKQVCYSSMIAVQLRLLSLLICLCQQSSMHDHVLLL